VNRRDQLLVADRAAFYLGAARLFRDLFAQTVRALRGDTALASLLDDGWSGSTKRETSRER